MLALRIGSIANRRRVTLSTMARIGSATGNCTLRMGRNDEIQCRLLHVPLSDAPCYEALSYTWADENGDSSLSSTIKLDKCPFLVTKNLAAALRQLRLSSSERIFWIDTICIDQKNDGERSHQVAVMRTIYEKANEVAIWLGTKYENSDLAFSEWSA